MHLVENYALGTGLKIGRPYIFDMFVPLPFDGDYISFQPYSKYDSKNYDYWEEAIKILMPKFNEKKIRIVQIGLAEEPKVFGAYDFRGKTSFNQAAYLIKNSILHLGTDSFGAHVASGFGKKVVGLYSVVYPSQAGPYWSRKKEHITIEPKREEGEKPTYSTSEKEKQINRIRPEEIALGVSRLLKLKLDFPYRTVAIGKNYGVKKVELLPEAPVENVDKAFSVDSIIVRMDLNFNEDVLYSQLKLSRCSILTNKEITLKILKPFKKRINEFIFLVDEKTDPEYFKDLQKASIKYYLMTHLEEEDLNKIKLNYLDLGPIIKRERKTFASIKEFEGKNIDNLFYRSSCFTVSKGLVYMSKDTSFNSTPIEDIANPPLLPVFDSDLFFEDFDHSIFYEKIA